MIVLDTNVISELVRGPRADPGVLSWVRSRRDQPVTTSLNRAERLAALASMPIGVMDALIASVALVNGAALATRDVDGFSGIGLTVHDPWADWGRT